MRSRSRAKDAKPPTEVASDCGSFGCYRIGMLLGLARKMPTGPWNISFPDEIQRPVISDLGFSRRLGFTAVNITTDLAWKYFLVPWQLVKTLPC